MTTLNGQTIGQAHYATRALLERHLTRLGISFPQSAALNAVAAEGGALARDALLRRMTDALKIDEPAARATLDDLVHAGLLRADGAGLALTDAGRTVQRRVGDAVAGITARLYGDIPAPELAAAGRLLTLIKQRADAELAATGA
ncbi:hypothetical protein [Micromonospora sp. NPDC003776]